LVALRDSIAIRPKSHSGFGRNFIQYVILTVERSVRFRFDFWAAATSRRAKSGRIPAEISEPSAVPVTLLMALFARRAE
jgi:hypothetical protein